MSSGIAAVTSLAGPAGEVRMYAYPAKLSECLSLPPSSKMQGSYKWQIRFVRPSIGG